MVSSTHLRVNFEEFQVAFVIEVALTAIRRVVNQPIGGCDHVGFNRNHHLLPQGNSKVLLRYSRDFTGCVKENFET
jgi:hypothetical protein